MDAHIYNPDLLLNARPEPTDFLHRLAGYIAREKPWRSFANSAAPLADDRRGLIGNRHAVNTALLGRAGRLGPAQMFEVEILKAGLPNFTHARACQHAQADDPRSAVVLRRIERRGQT